MEATITNEVKAQFNEGTQGLMIPDLQNIARGYIANRTFTDEYNFRVTGHTEGLLAPHLQDVVQGYLPRFGELRMGIAPKIEVSPPREQELYRDVAWVKVLDQPSARPTEFDFHKKGPFKTFELDFSSYPIDGSLYDIVFVFDGQPEIVSLTKVTKSK
jgi:hypothetical protein